MKKLFILFSLIFIMIFLISQASAFFGCGKVPDADLYSNIWKASDGSYHIRICDAPANNVKDYIASIGIPYNADGEIQGNFNIKSVSNKYEFYVGNNPISSIINTLTHPDDINLLDSASSAQLNRISYALNTLSLFALSDKSSQFTGFSDGLMASRVSGVVSKGKIEVPYSSSNVMYAGEIITKYDPGLGGDVFTYSQPEIRISGVSVKFDGREEREINWLNDQGYLAKYDTNNNILKKFTGSAGDSAIYNTKNKEIRRKSGKLFQDGQEIKNAYVKLDVQGEVYLCCLTTSDYCIPADSRIYPLKSLGTDCRFGLGEMFNAEKASVSGQSTDIINVKVLTKEQIKQLLALA